MKTLLKPVFLVCAFVSFVLPPSCSITVGFYEAIQFVTLQNEIDVDSVILPDFGEDDNKIAFLLNEYTTWGFYVAGQLRTMQGLDYSLFGRQSQVLSTSQTYILARHS